MQCCIVEGANKAGIPSHLNTPLGTECEIHRGQEESLLAASRLQMLMDILAGNFCPPGEFSNSWTMVDSEILLSDLI